MNMSDAISLIRSQDVRAMLIRYEPTSLRAILKTVEHSGIELIEPAFIPFAEPRDLFEGLMARRTATVAFAFCKKLFGTPICQHILKAAIDIDTPRQITWRTHPTGVQSFEYSGKIILITNEEVPPAIRARCMEITI